ncbi:hypothetical protein D2E70_25020 [Mycobacteroides abscessus]|uniref:hypothetical protein n=1 Tax=Mycobacteroides abscessus TaxID=36809 RepID=UPI000E6A2FE4|nr:hypothetical protein [Mycobacteroides abscessus]RIS64138.1 hypothetical protein D2E70_25020 [Mycobacteroides abscessus]
MFEPASDIVSMAMLSAGLILLLWAGMVALYELFLALAWFWIGIVALGAGSPRGFGAAARFFGLSLAIWAAIFASLSGTSILMSHMSSHPNLALATGPTIWGLLLIAIKPIRKYRDSQLAVLGYNQYPWSACESGSPGHV